MKKIVRFLFLLAILSVSCNLLTGGTAFVEVSGPIVGVLTAAALDEGGELVDPRYSFAQTAPQMTVVVQIGELTTSTPLSVTWYRVSEGGDEKLFERTIQVESFDRAYSVGLNPGLLASGGYKAVTTLGEGTATVEWTVVEEEQTQAAASDSTNASTAQTQPGASPTAGASGKIPASQSAGGGTPAIAGCTPETDVWPLTPRLFAYGLIGTEAPAHDLAPCASLGELEVVVWIGSNSPTPVCSFASPAGSCSSAGDPCRLPGGSDLPGTIVNVNLRQKQGGQVLAQNSLKLHADTDAPRVQLVTEPSNGVKVKEAQEITVSAIAEELNGVGWQTGVSRIYIDVMRPSFEEIANVPSGKSKAACEAKSWKQTTKEFKYTVPKGAKDDIFICAFADDYADPPNHGKDCATFHTGDVWTGSIHSETTGSYGTAGTCIGEAWDLQFRVVVNGDGSVNGKGDGHLASSPQCSGPGFTTWDGSDQANNVQFDVEGRFEGDRFELQIFETYIDGSTYGLYNYSLLLGSVIQESGLLVVPVTKDTAAEGETKTSYTESGGFVGTGTHTVKMICTTCDEPVTSAGGPARSAEDKIAISFSLGIMNMRMIL